MHYFDLARRLVELGADITARGDSGYPALIVCANQCEALEGDLSLPSSLIDRGGANVRGADGSTAHPSPFVRSGDSLAAAPAARQVADRAWGRRQREGRAAGQTPLSFASEDEMRALLRRRGRGSEKVTVGRDFFGDGVSWNGRHGRFSAPMNHQPAFEPSDGLQSSWIPWNHVRRRNSARLAADVGVRVAGGHSRWDPRTFSEVGTFVAVVCVLVSIAVTRGCSFGSA